MIAYIIALAANVIFMIIFGLCFWYPYLWARDLTRVGLWWLGIDTFLTSEKHTLGWVDEYGRALKSPEQYTRPAYKPKVKVKDAWTELEEYNEAHPFVERVKLNKR